MKTRTPQTLILAALLLVAGCGLTSEQRIAELQKAVTISQQLSQQLSTRIIELEKTLADAQVLAKQPNVPPQTVIKLQADIAALQARIAQAKPMQEALDKQLAAYEVQLKAALANPVDVGGEAQLYGQGVSTIGAVLPPPWNIYAGLIGSLIGVVGGVVGSVVKGKKDDKAVDGLTAGITALLDSPIVGARKEEAKSLLARSQAKNAGTVKLVQKSLTKAKIAKAA